MKSPMNKLLPVCLAMALVPVLALSAEPPPEPSAAPIGFGDLRVGRKMYAPQSGTSKATLGTLTMDADRVMSVVDFSSLKATNYFGYAGIDASVLDGGLNIGFGSKFGKNGKGYIGVAYGGSLINELASLIINQPVIGMKKQENINSIPDGTGGLITTSEPDLVDANNLSLPANATPYTSDNTLEVLLGAGIFGAKIGFTEFLQGTKTREDSYRETTIESSLKPYLELGLNIPIGKTFRFKPAIRGSYDFHQYNSTAWWGTTSPTTSAFNWTTKLEKLQDFDELSGGVSLGFDFNSTEHSRAELDITADLASRTYKNNGKYGISSTYTTSGGAGDAAYEAYETMDPAKAWAKGLGGNFSGFKRLTDPRARLELPITDIRIPVDVGFTFSQDFSPMFTLGVKGYVPFRMDIIGISQEDTLNLHTYDTTINNFEIRPDIAVGVNFNLLPDHFALQAGLGIELFSYQETTTTTVSDSSPEPAVSTEKLTGVPTVRLALGMSVNLNRDMAIDVLAVAANVVNIDKTKFTLMFTFKK
ncbi:hypothetical protein AGMMS49579_11730 [Spirochaetia bacterium]|nr:hypothetical protein AGMMS49579_11730 [Spirochaetia bacterium]